MIRKYLSAIVRGWAVWVTGSVAAAAIAAWVLTGNTLAPKLGIAFVMIGAVIAPYSAWYRAETGRQAAQARAERALDPPLQVEPVALGFEVGNKDWFAVYLRVTNPGEPTTMGLHPTLILRRSGRAPVGPVQGSWYGGVPRLDTRDQQEVVAVFPYSDEVADPPSVFHSDLVLSVAAAGGKPVTVLARTDLANHTSPLEGHWRLGLLAG